MFPIITANKFNSALGGAYAEPIKKSFFKLHFRRNQLSQKLYFNFLIANECFYKICLGKAYAVPAWQMHGPKNMLGAAMHMQHRRCICTADRTLETTKTASAYNLLKDVVVDI